MDGFAFDSSQLREGQPLQLDVVGTALAGRVWQGRVHAGQAVKIMTGAIMPAGLAREPGLRLRLLHQHVIEHQHQAVLDLVHQPRRRLEPVGKLAEQAVQKRKRGLCCHSPLIIHDRRSCRPP